MNRADLDLPLAVHRFRSQLMKFGIETDGMVVTLPLGEFLRLRRLLGVEGPPDEQLHVCGVTFDVEVPADVERREAIP